MRGKSRKLDGKAMIRRETTNCQFIGMRTTLDGDHSANQVTVAAKSRLHLSCLLVPTGGQKHQDGRELERIRRWRGSFLRCQQQATAYLRNTSHSVLHSSEDGEWW